MGSHHRTLIFSFARRREQFVLDESTRIEKAKATTVIGFSLSHLVRDGQRSAPDDEWNGQASIGAGGSVERMVGTIKSVAGMKIGPNETRKPGLLPLHVRLATFLFC